MSNASKYGFTLYTQTLKDIYIIQSKENKVTQSRFGVKSFTVEKLPD